MDLNELGFTKEELQQRVVEHIAKQVMAGVSLDEDGNEFDTDSSFARKLRQFVAEHVDKTIDALAQKYVLPNVARYVEDLSLQETNKWGEKTGNSLTFVEYLVKRAEEYMLEKVDFEGRAKGERDGYSWKGTQTRLTHLVEKHLHYSIESAMKNALLIANNTIAKGIEETVKTKLALISEQLKMEVKTK